MQLTDDQLKFLCSMNVPLSKVFDASGMATYAYMQQMSDLDLWIAYGVTPCKNAGHTLRTRKGHCVQCRTAQLTYLRRHEVTGSVYVAHSGKQGLVKVGMTERDPADRLLALNSYSYGGCNDWKIVFQVRCNSAGRVEFSVHQKLTSYSLDAEYFNNGTKVVCRELFRCNPNTAIAAVQQCSGTSDNFKANVVDAWLETSLPDKPKHRAVMFSEQKKSRTDRPRGQRLGDFAGELKLSAASLLEQLQKAGVQKSSADDWLSESDKAKLLDYLRAAHGEAQAKAKITLTRKQTSKTRTVQVELRKKRVLVKRVPEGLGSALSATDCDSLSELVRRWKTYPATKRAEIRALIPDADKEFFDRMTLHRRNTNPRSVFNASVPVRGTEASAIPSKTDGPPAPDLYKAVKVASNSTELEARIRAAQDAAYRVD